MDRKYVSPAKQKIAGAVVLIATLLLSALMMEIALIGVPVGMYLIFSKEQLLTKDYFLEVGEAEDFYECDEL